MFNACLESVCNCLCVCYSIFVCVCVCVHWQRVAIIANWLQNLVENQVASQLRSADCGGLAWQQTTR